MSLRGFLIVIVCQHFKKTAAAFANLLALKRGALFSLIYVIGSFCIYYIPNNYVIPQAMPRAIPQTHSAFYPNRISKTKVKIFVLHAFTHDQCSTYA